MTETIWFLVVGGVLIFMGLASSTFKQLPISSAMVYLAIGFGLGPFGIGLLKIDLLGDSTVLRRITEVAMLVSLFAIGLRLRVPPSDRIWLLPLRLGFVAMVATVAIMTLACVYLLHMNWGPALLIAAMLAPTDPVLAHDVQVQVPGDIDLLRFSLTGEGGLNDGIALPFALLGIAVCNFEASPDQALSWHFAVDALWGVGGALAVGWMLGDLAVRLIAWLRTRHGLALGPEGFYALGLIALSYGIAELVHTYAFLAVFAAGLALRRVEQKASGDKSVHAAIGTVNAEDVGATASDPDRAHAFVAERVLGFTIELERIAEAAVMLMIGSALANRLGPAFYVARRRHGRVAVSGGAAGVGAGVAAGFIGDALAEIAHQLVRNSRCRVVLLPALRAGACAAQRRRTAGAARAGRDRGIGDPARHYVDAADELVSAKLGALFAWYRS